MSKEVGEIEVAFIMIEILDSIFKKSQEISINLHICIRVRFI